MKYGAMDVAAFCEAHLAFAPGPLKSEADVVALQANHIAYVAMLTYRDFGIDPVAVLQAAIDRIRTDAMIVVNEVPREVEG